MRLLTTRRSPSRSPCRRPRWPRLPSSPTDYRDHGDDRPHPRRRAPRLLARRARELDPELRAGDRAQDRHDRARRHAHLRRPARADARHDRGPHDQRHRLGRVQDARADQGAAAQARVSAARRRPSPICRCRRSRKRWQTIGTRALINLDKAWGYRDQILAELIETGTVETAVFKSNAAVADVAGVPRQGPADSSTRTSSKTATPRRWPRFGDHPPESFEIVFDRLTDAQIQPAVGRRGQAQEPDLHQHDVVRARRPLHRRGVADRPRPRLEAGHRASPRRRHPDRQRRTSCSATCVASTSPSPSTRPTPSASRARTTRPRARASATRHQDDDNRGGDRVSRRPRASTSATSRARPSCAGFAAASG